MERPSRLWVKGILKGAEKVQEVLSGSAQLILEESLYLCSVEELLQSTWICPSQVECLLLVGHNPTMEYLTDLVTRGDCRIKTSEVRSFKVHRDSWNGLTLSDLEYDQLIYSH